MAVKIKKEASKKVVKPSRTAKPQEVDYPRTGLATVKEAAAFLKMHEITVYRMITKKQIAARHFPTGDIRIDWEVLWNYGV